MSIQLWCFYSQPLYQFHAITVRCDSKILVYRYIYNVYFSQVALAQALSFRLFDILNTLLHKMQSNLDIKGCLDWDFFATFLRLFSDADAQVRKRRDSFASTQATQLCRVRRVGCTTHS